MILKSKPFQPRITRIHTEKKPWPAWVFVSASLGERAFLDEIQRDLRDLSAINVDGIAALPRLLQVVALRVGSPLNMADLGRTLGLNQVTLKRYLTLFEALFLVKRLPPWFENMGKRLAKTPKLYFNDAGLLGYLLDLDPESLDSRPTQVGPLVENFVVMELTKLVAWSRVRPSLYHMRTSAGLEVDSVMENRKRELVGIEVKASMTLSDSDFKGLRELQEAVGKRMKSGVVLYSGREILPFGKGLWAMPIQALWGYLSEGDRLLASLTTSPPDPPPLGRGTRP